MAMNRSPRLKKNSFLYWLSCIFFAFLPGVVVGLYADGNCPRNSIAVLYGGWAILTIFVSFLFFNISSPNCLFYIIFFITPFISICVCVVGLYDDFTCESIHSFVVYLHLAFCVVLLVWYGIVFVCYLLGSFLCWPKLDNPVLDESSIDMQIFSIGDGNIEIGMSMSPGRTKADYMRDLDQDLHYLQNLGFNRIICMLDEFALEEMNMMDYANRCRCLNLEYHWIPLRDKWIPLSSHFFEELINVYKLMQESGKEKILVHCNGGRGRTGVFVVCLLLLYKFTYTTAVAKMRNTRVRMLRNPMQILFCYHCYFFNVLQDLQPDFTKPTNLQISDGFMDPMRKNENLEPILGSSAIY